MKCIHIPCPICGTKKNYSVLYPKNFQFRDLNTDVFSARRMPDTIHYQLVTCHTCGLVRSTPTISASTLSELYQKSRLTYDDEIVNLTSTYVRAVKPIIEKLPHTAHILEIGCGNGFVLKSFRDMGYANVYGIEPSADAIAKAHRSIQKNLRKSVLKKGIFKKETFDCIFFFQTLDHIPDPNAFLRECHRLLKRNGSIISFNHNIDSLSSKILGEKSPIIDIEHTFLYSPKTVSLLFQKNGFQVNRVYSPTNTVTLRHIIWLLPIPKRIKMFFLKSTKKILDWSINIKLGNICLIAGKI